MTITQNVKTGHGRGHGTVHVMNIGQTFTIRGVVLMNRPGQAAGKTICGALTSMAARVVDSPVTCEKCRVTRQEN